MQAIPIVVEEFGAQNETESEFFVHDDKDLFSCPENRESLNEGDEKQLEKGKEEELEEYSNAANDDEFEFTFVAEFSPISADEIFYNGMIRPIFNRYNVVHLKNGTKKTSDPPTPLLMETASSSGTDDLEGIPPGTYFIWRPSTKPESPKNINSPGSSKRLKFRDFLQRSNSNSNDSFVFLREERNIKEVEVSSKCFRGEWRR